MDSIRNWITAGAALSLMAAAASRSDDFGPRYKRTKARKPKTAAQMKRAKAQKAQRIARRKNRQ